VTLAILNNIAESNGILVISGNWESPLVVGNSWHAQVPKLKYLEKTPTNFPFRQIRRWLAQYCTESFFVTTDTATTARSTDIPERDIFELMGSVHYGRCLSKCSDDTFKVRHGPNSKCPNCGSMTVPALLELGQENDTYRAQCRFLDAFIERHTTKYRKLLVLALGTLGDSYAIATAYQLAEHYGTPLISVDVEDVDEYKSLDQVCFISSGTKVTKAMIQLENELKALRRDVCND
jgi:NAD-dependent SIR2 family protein deacetylase